jgi:hypothetical protein
MGGRGHRSPLGRGGALPVRCARQDSQVPNSWHHPPRMHTFVTSFPAEFLMALHRYEARIADRSVSLFGLKDGDTISVQVCS